MSPRKSLTSTKKRVYAELGGKTEAIFVSYDFDMDRLAAVQSVPGGRWRDGAWRFPKDLETARNLQRAFGSELELGPRMEEWAGAVVDREAALTDLALADSAQLLLLEEKLPELYEAVFLGPKGIGMTAKEKKAAFAKGIGSYQTADVKYLAEALNMDVNPLNGIHPGLGKTLETIAAIHEADRDDGFHLVICPVTSIETVWVAELERWQYLPVLAATGGRDEKEIALMAAQEFLEEGEPFWLVVNPAMIQYKGIYEYNPDNPKEKYLVDVEKQWPFFWETVWDHVILDEVHKAGFRNLNSLTARAMLDLQADKRIGLSGTPVGGRPVNLWRILHWLNPDYFKSMWRWAEQWLVIEEKTYHVRGGGGRENVTKQPGAIKPELEKLFYKSHAQFFLRRTKAECLPDLPPKQPIDHWAEMSPGQAKQYKEFALEAEVKIDDYELSATSILAEYTRLKQFAIARQTVERIPNPDTIQGFDIKLKPTSDSCKLAVLEEILDELGIFDPGDEQVVIFSQFNGVVEMVYNWLVTDKGVAAEKMTGATTGQKRAEVQRDFQDTGGARILVMNVMVGGVSITLDRADTVIFMDETWVPDDQEQAEDRCHRASRIHQVTCHYIRTKDTIEEYIHQVTGGKQNVNNMILDLRRMGFKALKGPGVSRKRK